MLAPACNADVFRRGNGSLVVAPGIEAIPLPSPTQPAQRTRPRMLTAQRLAGALTSTTRCRHRQSKQSLWSTVGQDSLGANGVGYSWVMEVARQALNGVRYVRPGACHEVHQRPDHRSVFKIIDLGAVYPLHVVIPKRVSILRAYASCVKEE
ncbi:hypothetical protein AeRB84_019551 [Aphanomyces euteiches]|nr:hypothetical protein AeRB84_019551 [Aphanomyces euteiches]